MMLIADGAGSIKGLVLAGVRRKKIRWLLIYRLLVSVLYCVATVIGDSRFEIYT